MASCSDGEVTMRLASKWARAVVIGSVGLLAASGVGSAAVAVEDTEPPVLTTPRLAEFVKGSQVSGTAYSQHGEYLFFITSDILANVPWVAEDVGSGICDVTVERQPVGGPPREVVSGAPAIGSYTEVESDYEDQLGGGGFKTLGWHVAATDCAGNITTNFVTGRPVATQEDNYTAGYRGVTITYEGQWSTELCTDCLKEAAAMTSDRGATATMEAVPGARIALVLRQGPEYGVADIYIEGKRRGSVSAFSPVPTERAIVWTRQLKDTESTVQIVNRGRQQAPLLGLDAVITRPLANPVWW